MQRLSDKLLDILILPIIVLVFALGIYLGEMNIKRIAIERGVARINQAGEFEFYPGYIECCACKSDGSC